MRLRRVSKSSRHSFVYPALASETYAITLRGNDGCRMFINGELVLMAWYLGQQGGMAVSEIITGRISPSGRLPISIEKTLADNPVNENYYENVDRMRPEEINPYSRVEYREGVFVGYRGYEKNNVEHLWRISVLPAVLPLRRSKVSIRKSRFCVLIA